MKTPLTDRQARVYRCICETFAATGRAPLIRELAASLGIGSGQPSSVVYHIRALERKGWVVRVGADNRTPIPAELLPAIKAAAQGLVDQLPADSGA